VFTIKVTGCGTAVANVVVTDPIPSVVQYVSSTTTQGSCSYNSATRTLTCSVGTINFNQTVTIKITTKLVQSVQVFQNCARLNQGTVTTACVTVKLGQPPHARLESTSGGGDNALAEFLRGLWDELVGLLMPSNQTASISADGQ
jgi:uncharacterized repeat protein (TIGR01451 family)